MTKIIEVKDLVKKYDKKKVINGISFSIEKGEIFGFLGPSGAGKTTLIKMLTGQLPGTAGTIKIFDKLPEEYDENIFSKLGMVMDNSGLYERLSCYDNLLLFAELYKVDKKKIDDALRILELDDAKDKAVKELSKGMKQRLVLARSILHKPEILFLDEPTSGLDPATSKKVHDLLFDLRKKGTTIFLTTHNMEEATLLCDNVALLHLGSIVEYGEPLAVCRKYNRNNSITILDNEEKTYVLKNSKEDVKKIVELFEKGKVVSIHSSEPTLESVFIELTGKELV